MSHAYSNPDYAFSPEQAIRQIRSERKRNSMLALGAGVLALVVFGLGIYLAYDDVPAPESPANAKPNVAQPQR